MEDGKKKRGRDEEENYSEINPAAKKQEVSHNHYSCQEMNNLKVFDFPWLHEEQGMISKSEDLFNFDDTFSSILNDNTYCSIAGVQIEFSGDTISAAVVPLEDNFEMRPLEEDDGGLQMDGADCIWGSLLNQPLQHTLS